MKRGGAWEKEGISGVVNQGSTHSSSHRPMGVGRITGRRERADVREGEEQISNGGIKGILGRRRLREANHAVAAILHTRVAVAVILGSTRGWRDTGGINFWAYNWE